MPIFNRPIALDTALSLTSYVLSRVLSERERHNDSDRTTYNVRKMQRRSMFEGHLKFTNSYHVQHAINEIRRFDSANRLNNNDNDDDYIIINNNNVYKQQKNNNNNN